MNFSLAKTILLGVALVSTASAMEVEFQRFEPFQSTQDVWEYQDILSGISNLTLDDMSMMVDNASTNQIVEMGNMESDSSETDMITPGYGQFHGHCENFLGDGIVNLSFLDLNPHYNSEGKSEAKQCLHDSIETFYESRKNIPLFQQEEALTNLIYYSAVNQYETFLSSEYFESNMNPIDFLKAMIVTLRQVKEFNYQNGTLFGAQYMGFRLANDQQIDLVYVRPFLAASLKLCEYSVGQTESLAEINYFTKQLKIGYQKLEVLTQYLTNSLFV